MQMSAQAACGKETMIYQSLFDFFLSLNRLAVEDKCKVGWAYETDLWKDLSERCKRIDNTCRPDMEATRIDEHRRARVRNRVSMPTGGSSIKREASSGSMHGDWNAWNAKKRRAASDGWDGGWASKGSQKREGKMGKRN